MSTRLNRLRSMALRSICGFALLVLSQGAYAMSVSPSTSYTGSYTVNWSNIVGCQQTGGYPYYPEECYYLQERVNSGAWTTISASGSSKAFSSQAPATYQYRIYFVLFLMGRPWDEYVVEGPVTGTVTAPATPGTPSGPTTTNYSGAYTIYRHIHGG